MEQQGKQILFSCSAGLLTVRVPLFFPHRAVGVNVEIQTTCCMKQLRHYACCRPDAPAPPRLREVRVQAADGDLAVEQNSTSGTRFVDTFFSFLKSTDGLEFFFLNFSVLYKNALPKTQQNLGEILSTPSGGSARAGSLPKQFVRTKSTCAQKQAEIQLQSYQCLKTCRRT